MIKIFHNKIVDLVLTIYLHTLNSVKIYKWFLDGNNRHFILSKYIYGFSISDFPHLESESSKWFEKKLRSSQKYLEYGSGGSTYLAAKFNISFITIESDKRFLKALICKIRKDGFFNANKQFYILRKTGFIERWAYPLRGLHLTKKQIENFKKYSNPPRELSSSYSLPDFVLIDGRFRVACFLKLLKLLNKSKNWTIAIDDYANRPEYHVVERYAPLDFCIGKMGIFSKTHIFDSDIDRLINYYELIPN
jgi:hypothetical protein